MGFRKERFGKRSDRYSRNDRFQKGQHGSRSIGSRYGKDFSEGSRYNGGFGGDSRFGGGSSFRRESAGERRMERTTVVCADCGNDCVIPFKPKDSRPVYCRECFQEHKPHERRDSGFNRNDRDSRYERNSDKNSRYERDILRRYEKDRTPIHSRDNFRKNRYKPNNFVMQKRKNKFNSDDDSDLFYSTLRTKLFKILGGKRCFNCGFDDERALGFGHIDDEESFDYGQRGGSASSWEKYVAEPELARKSLQILCFNCNQINQN